MYMEKITYTTCFVLGVIIVIAIVIALINFTSNSKPVEIYQPIILEPINLNAVGKTYEYKFRNYYEGKHSVSIVVGNPPQIGESYDPYSLDLNLEIYLDSKLILEKSVKSGLYPFWDVSENKLSGLSLLNYNAPSEVPINKDILLKLRVLSDNQEFHKRFKNARILIKKISDE